MCEKVEPSAGQRAIRPVRALFKKANGQVYEVDVSKASFVILGPSAGAVHQRGDQQHYAVGAHPAIGKTMSTCANIYCLFKVAPSQERVAEVQKAIWNRLGFDKYYQGPEKQSGLQYGVLAQEYGADEEYDFHEDGTLHKRFYGRVGSASVEPSREGRFYHISYLSRWWSENYPEGPLMEYVVTMLVLLEQTDIEHVWYADDHYIEANPVSRQGLHVLIDTYIRIGTR